MSICRPRFTQNFDKYGIKWDGKNGLKGDKLLAVKWWVFWEIKNGKSGQVFRSVMGKNHVILHYKSVNL